MGGREGKAAATLGGDPAVAISMEEEKSDAATAQHASYPSQFLFDMEEPAIGYPAAVRMVMKGEQGGDYGPCTATWHAAARRI